MRVDVEQAHKSIERRFGSLPPVMTSLRVAYSERLEYAVDAADAPLSRREVRAVLDYKFGIFKRFFPGVLDGSPTLGSLLRRPTAFAMALLICSASRHGKGKSRIREFMEPLNKSDPVLGGLAAMLDASPVDQESCFGEIVRIVRSGTSAEALVAFHAAAFLDPILDYPKMRSIHSRQDAVDDVDALLHVGAHSQLMSYLMHAGLAQAALDEEGRRTSAAGAAADVRGFVRLPQFDECLQRVYPGRTLEEVLPDPEAFRRLEVEFNGRPTSTLHEFGENKSLLKDLSSRADRRAVVTDLIEGVPGEGVRRSTDVGEAFVRGLIQVAASQASPGFFMSFHVFATWFALTHPSISLALAKALDGWQHAEVAGTYVRALLRTDVEAASKSLASALVSMDKPLLASLERTASVEETRLPEEDDQEDLAPGEPAVDPDAHASTLPAEEGGETSGSDAGIPAVGADRVTSAGSPRSTETASATYLTPEAADAAASWRDALAGLRSAVAETHEDLASIGDPEPLIERVRAGHEAMRASAARYAAAIAPVRADALLARLEQVNEGIFAVSGGELDPHRVPRDGFVLPHEHAPMEAKVVEGEAASDRIQVESNAAEAAHAEMLSAPLGERRRLGEAFGRHSDEMMRQCGVAWEAIAAALGFLVVDAARPDPDAAGAGTEASPGPAAPEEVAPVAPWIYPEAAAAVRRTVLERGFAEALAEARNADAADLADMAAPVLEAVSLPGRIETERFFEKSATDAFELAEVHLSEVPEEAREDMTGLLAIASVEGSTFAPGSVYSNILSNAGRGRIGAIAHLLEGAISSYVQRAGVPTPSGLKAIRDVRRAESRRGPIVASLRQAIEVARSANYSYRSATLHRDRLFAPDGYFARIDAALTDRTVPPDLVETARTLADPRRAGEFLNGVADEVGADKLHSSGRMKFVDAVASVSGQFVEACDLDEEIPSEDAPQMALAAAVGQGLAEARRLAETAADPFARACLERCGEILRRYDDLVNGRAARPAAA